MAFRCHVTYSNVIRRLLGITDLIDNDDGHLVQQSPTSVFEMADLTSV